MKPEDLIRRYPVLFHMAEDGSWPSIQRHGLLSTSALLDLFEVHAERRSPLERQRRPASVELHHGVHGSAVIRDQLPMRDSVLARVLDGGMSTADWYGLLNSHVFFWLSEDRLDRLLRARAYRDRPHLVLHVDTAAIVDRHRGAIRLTAINTGSTLFNAPRRGVDAFHTIESYPYDRWLQRRGRRDAIAELAVVHAVPDIDGAVTSVTRRLAGNVLEQLR